MLALTSTLLLLSVGCNNKDTDSGPADDTTSFTWPDRGADPWEDLDAVALDPLRSLTKVALDGGDTPSRLLPIGDRALTGVLDLGAGGIHVLDHRYHHLGTPQCVDLTFFDGFEVGDRQGDCATGSIEINRGHLSPPGQIVTAAADDVGLGFFAITSDGKLHRAEADVLVGDPFDYLRLLDPVTLADAGSIPEGALAIVVDDTLWLAQDRRLRAWSLSGALQEDRELPGQPTALLWQDGPWVATDDGLYTGDGSVIDVVGARLAYDGAAMWLTVPETDEVIRIEDGEQTAFVVDGLLAAAAADETTGRLYVSTTDGVAVLEDGVEIVRRAADVPADLAVTVSHEVLALGADGKLEVFLDEESLAGPEPLDIVPITFFEKPRSPEEDLGCRDEDQSVKTNAERALANMPLIEDLPGRFAFAVTPHAALRVVECNEQATFTAAIDHDFLEHGALFHREYGGCGDDQECHQTEMATELDKYPDAGVSPLWATGLTPHVDSGADWVQALLSVSDLDRFLFFGMSVLPEVPHHTDPRGKEPFPLAADTRAAAWRVSSAQDTWPGDPDGEMTFYPGDSVAAFTQGGCPNVFIQECRLVSGGGGQRLEADDIVVLQLQLHRAIAARQDGDVNSWSFHLPDLGAFDYVSDCTQTDRTWTGEDCQAQVLQEWMFDLHQRYIQNGVARWATPSELGTP